MALSVDPVASAAATYDQLARAHPAAAFVVPTTRFLATTINLQNPERSERDPLTAELVPTAPGDPLLSEAQSQDLAAQPVTEAMNVAVSRPVADRLGVTTGAGEYAPMPPVLGPWSSSRNRL